MTTPRPSIEKPFLALVLMCVTALSFATMGALVKTLGGALPAFVVAFYRTLINLGVVLFILQRRAQLHTIKADPSLRAVLLSRGGSGTIALICSFSSLMLLPLAVATLLNWLSPLFTCVLSHYFLNETVSGRQLRFIALAFLGLVFLVMPGMVLGTVSLLGALLGIGGAFFAGVAQTSIRKAAARSSAEVIVFYFVGIASLTLFPAVVGHYAATPLSLSDDALLVGPLLGVGILGTAGQIAMTHAYRFAAASLVSVMGLITPAVSVLLGWVVFGESLVPVQWLGVAAISSGVLGVVSKRETLSDTTEL